MRESPTLPIAHYENCLDCGKSVWYCEDDESWFHRDPGHSCFLASGKMEPSSTLRTVDLTPDVDGLIRWITESKPGLEKQAQTQATTLYWLAVTLPYLSAGDLFAVATGQATLRKSPETGWQAVTVEN